MSDTLRLYHAPSSPNSRRVRIFLAEKGMSLPLVAVDLGKGEQHAEAYRAINPRRVVPTLVLEDGTAVGEVLAIWRYLEEIAPNPLLLGGSPKLVFNSVSSKCLKRRGNSCRWGGVALHVMG
jgi:glutathione S-transferase